jgi:hypothetical protein
MQERSRGSKGRGKSREGKKRKDMGMKETRNG